MYKVSFSRLFASVVITSQFVLPFSSALAAEPPSSLDELGTTASQGEIVVSEESAVAPVESAESPADIQADPPQSESLGGETAPVETSAQSEAVVASPELSTDKADYYPGETATIFGRFFQSVQDILLKIFGGSAETNDYTETIQNITTDSEGSFTTTYTLDGLARPLYTVIASALSGEELARTTFTDPPSVEFDQCANDNPTAGACDWIGSILQANNSVYFEGMSVPQRLLYRGIGNGAHTISFKYSYTKGGTHAYDFITGKNQGNGSFSPGISTFNDCGNLTGPDLAACTALIATTEGFVPIPNDAFDSKDSAPGAGTGTSQTAKETFYGARSISVYNTGTFTASTTPIVITHDVAADGDTGDSDAQVTLNFTLASCGGGCDVMLYFDGHLAVGGSDNTTGVNWGPALGSANINGGP